MGEVKAELYILSRLGFRLYCSGCTDGHGLGYLDLYCDLKEDLSEDLNQYLNQDLNKHKDNLNREEQRDRKENEL